MFKRTMQKSSKRSMRRHHKQRMIQRAKRSSILRGFSSDEQLRFARKLADHLKVCSCEYSCGNVRHNGWSSEKVSLTRQELRHRLDCAEQLLEADEDTSP